MNDLLLHEQYVTDHLEDRTASRSLIDRHEEELEVPHRVAIRAVASIRRQSRNARDLARAGNLLAAGSWVRGPLLASMILYCGRHPDFCFASVLVLPGSRPPRIVSQTHEGQHPSIHYTIEVGARWVISEAKRNVVMVGQE